MWEGRPIENGNDWPLFSSITDNCKNSTIMSGGFSKTCYNYDPYINEDQKRQYNNCENGGNPEEVLVPPVPDDISSTSNVSWQQLTVTLHRAPKVGFGIAVSGGRDNPHFTSGDPAVVVSDVIRAGPAWGLVQVNDRILVANGVSLENAEYAAAVKIMKESQQLNMIVKRRAPVPLMEFEQRTLKFTLTKSKKKEDFGIVLGCKFYIKEITNRKLAEKEPGLKEGDTILRINGQSVDGITIEEATKWLTRSREKLSLVIQRDVRTGTSRWPSQNTIYERLGSVTTTPRHSPSPMHMSHHYPASPQQPSTAELMSNSASNSRWFQSQSEQPSDYGDCYKRNGSIASSHCNVDNEMRTIRFRKVGGSLGVRVIGGNHVGIFVSAVQEGSPAALNGIKPGDQILVVNGKSMIGVTREEVVQHLLSLKDDVTIGVQYAPGEFERVRANQLGDSFYIRTHFSHQKTSNPLELSFHNGDIFLVTDTLFGGTVGLWQATRVYSSMESSTATAEPLKGVIPNYEGAEKLAAASRTDTFTLGRSTFFRRKLKERRTKSLSKNVIDDPAFSENSGEMVLPAYERVTLKQPSFQRPIVLYGPLADVARQRLLTNFALCFASPGDDSIIRLSNIDAVIRDKKHCLLDVSPGSVERLQLAQYAPIVILIDVDSRSRIRELRSKAGASMVSSRKLIEQTHKIKKHYSHILTAMLDATKEDGWFEALRQLIAHLQDRRVWMPEFRPSTNLNDVFLLPMQSFQNQSDSDVDSLKGEYSGNDYTTQRNLQKELEESVFRSSYESNVDNSGNYISRTQLKPPSASSTGSLISRFPPHAQKNFPYAKEQYGYYSFKTPLQSPNQHQLIMSSPVRRLMADGGIISTNLPWATLPRRIQHGSASSSPALNTTANMQQESKVSLPLQHPSIDRVMSQASPSHFREAVTTSVRSSPSKTHPSNFPEESFLARRSVTSPAPCSSIQTKLSTEERMLNENLAAGYDVKHTLVEQNANYYGPDSMIESVKSIVPENPSSSSHHHYLASQSHSSSQARSGLFLDHVTRNRWNTSSQNERRQPLLPAQLSSRSSQLQTSPLALSQTNSAPSDGNIRYVDESPVEFHQQSATSAAISNSDRGESIGIKSPRVIEVDESLDYQSSKNDVSFEGEQNRVKKITSEISSTVGKEMQQEDDAATIIEHVSDVVDAGGGTLNCPQSGVMLIIPEGAIKDGVQQEIYVKVCRANGNNSRPPLDESRGESLMSPLVMCGPQNLQFRKPVELRLPHSASNNGENWSFALKSGTGKEWEQISLDENTSSLVTDKFVSVKINHF